MWSRKNWNCQIDALMIVALYKNDSAPEKKIIVQNFNQVDLNWIQTQNRPNRFCRALTQDVSVFNTRENIHYAVKIDLKISNLFYYEEIWLHLHVQVTEACL